MTLLKRMETSEKGIPTEVPFKVYCDICSDRNLNPDPIEWAEEMHEVNEVIIQYRKGHEFPNESRDIKVLQYHICPTCFEKRVRPALRDLGAVPTVTRLR